ncbi:MAG: cytochrome P450 [Dehalococcoidia bacterium]|nr:cytochrome P450 [Dehalococcoidia bacterium]
MTATEESSAFADAIREQLKLAIEPQEFDSPEFQRDPFPLYKRLRDHHPIYQDLFHKRWVVSRYDDIVEVFQNNDDFDRAVYDPKGDYEFGKKQVFGPNILEYGNSAEHRFLRNVVADQFVGNRLAGFLPFIEQIARELMGKIWEKSADDIARGFSDTGEVELVSEFTTQFPIRVISNMLGLPREDEDTFVRWYQHLIVGLGFGGEYFAKGMQARNEMWDYLDPLIRRAEDSPGEDLISRIVHAEFRGQRMNVDEIKGFIALLLAAGGDTTDKAIANMWYHMLYTRPDQFEEVKKDGELWTNVFTEMMRYDPVVHTQGRRTTHEITIHGEVIPERANIIMYLAAGNRDERAFKDPNTYDIFRDDLHMGRELRSGRYPDGKHGHLGFGMGQHFCMGYAMARQEAIIACTRLSEAMKNPRPKFPTHAGITSPVMGSGGFRAPEELWIEFDVN